MTAKEKLLEFAPRWTEHQAEVALKAVEAEGDDQSDDWGNLDAQMDAGMRESLRELDEDERKAGLEPWRP